MPTPTGHPQRIRLASHDRVHRNVTRSDLTGLMTRPQRTRLGGSYLWIIPLVIGIVGIVSYAKLQVVAEAWSAIASSALGTTLFAIALTVGVCGSIASAVIWWALQQEHWAMTIHRTAIHQYLSTHGAQGARKEPRLAA